MIVIDASIATAWLLAEKSFSASASLLDMLSRESFLAPPHWPTEIGNAIRKAVRTRRILKEDVQSLIASVASVDVSITAPLPVSELGSLVQFALEHGLSVYDAAYVRLAAVRSLPLATLDDAMTVTARKIGVAVISA